MTWQLTTKSNRGCDLLTEPNVRVSNQSSETLWCKIQSPPNVRGVLCNLALFLSFSLVQCEILLQAEVSPKVWHL